MFIVLLYVFRATMCLSSGEITVPLRHLVFVTLYEWCRIGTVFSPDDRHIIARKIMHQVGSFYKIVLYFSLHFCKHMFSQFEVSLIMDS
jgi:hypothetical protein